MYRVEKHIFTNNRNLDRICFLSKNLYNYCNYLIRQEFIANGKMLSEYELTGSLARKGQIDYISLPAQTSQQVVKLLFKNWKSFFKLCKCKDKLNGRPKMPKYKHKTRGRNVVVFTGQQYNIKKGFVHFPKKSHISPVKTNVHSKIKEVRIVPKYSCFIIEIVYEKEKRQVDLNPGTYLSIDIGVNNLATSYNPQSNDCFIVNGRPLKSINQYFNKRRAAFMSYVGDRGSSNRLRSLTFKRNKKINDYLHKASRYIVNYCISNKIENIVVGHNNGWKTGCNMSKKINQNFISIPFNDLIHMIEYKAEEVGISLIKTEESYTSKIDHFAMEEMKHQESYLGKRTHRGLFESSTGKILNADLNGSIGILRKVANESFNMIVSRGLVSNPIIVNV